jgi:tetratricopeptide (TPR) repeat protein
VSRRQFLHGLGAAASIGVIGDTSANPAAARSSLASLAPGADPVTHFRELRRVLIDSDNLFGPLRVAPAVGDQIAVIHQLRQASRGEDYRDLTHVLAQYAEFAAWLAQDLGDYPAAESWLRRALEWSHIAGDPDLIVFILARASQLAGDIAEDPSRTIQLGEAAITMARPRSRLAAVAATYAAHGYALDGGPDQCARSYDRAHDLLADADDPDSAWAAWLDTAYIEVQRAHSQAMLGDYTTAATGFGSAIAALPTGYHRDRGVYLARQALAHAGGQDLEHAADLGLQALLIGTTTHSGRVLTELDRLNTLLDQAPAAPSVAQFRDALASVIVEPPV